MGGCGVFENDAVKVGVLLGEVLREKEFSGLLDEVVVTGGRAFSQAVVKSSNAEDVPCYFCPPTRAVHAPAVAMQADALGYTDFELHLLDSGSVGYRKVPRDLHGKDRCCC